MPRSHDRGFNVRPVTPRTWPDFAQLFTGKGCPHYCWCMPYRDPDAHRLSASQKRARMKARVEKRVPIGLLAYDHDEPVAWCSVAPRTSYARLSRSKVMPPVDPPEATWTVLCFFVRRSHRGKGLTKALLRQAVAYAGRRGARFVEGYPFDTAGLSSRNLGHSKAFRAAGFKRSKGRRWSRRTKAHSATPSEAE